MRMQNKIGIVTAAGSGMGRAGAIRFAKEGASVAVVDLNADAAAAVVKDITDAGGKAMAISGDLTDDAFARNIVRDTVRAYGGLDFVWNHVGHPGPPARPPARPRMAWGRTGRCAHGKTAGTRGGPGRAGGRAGHVNAPPTNIF